MHCLLNEHIWVFGPVILLTRNKIRCLNIYNCAYENAHKGTSFFISVLRYMTNIKDCSQPSGFLFLAIKQQVNSWRVNFQQLQRKTEFKNRAIGECKFLIPFCLKPSPIASRILNCDDIMHTTWLYFTRNQLQNLRGKIIYADSYLIATCN